MSTINLSAKLLMHKGLIQTHCNSYSGNHVYHFSRRKKNFLDFMTLKKTVKLVSWGLCMFFSNFMEQYSWNNIREVYLIYSVGICYVKSSVPKGAF